jgi:hypothetical protein
VIGSFHDFHAAPARWRSPRFTVDMPMAYFVVSR